MSRKTSTLVMIVAFLLASTAMTAPPEGGYTVALRDGSFVKAAEKPVVEDGVASIRLPNGLLARVAEERIDWDRSDQLTYLVAEPAVESKWPVGKPRELTVEGPPGDPTPIPTPVMVRVPEIDRGLRIEERIYRIDDRIEQLRYDIADLGRRLYVDDGPAAGNGPGRWSLDVEWALRDEMRDVEKEIRRLRRERTLFLRKLRRDF